MGIQEIIDFCNELQFAHSWASDILKIIIIVSIMQLFIILSKLIIKWRI